MRLGLRFAGLYVDERDGRGGDERVESARELLVWDMMGDRLRGGKEVQAYIIVGGCVYIYIRFGRCCSTDSPSKSQTSVLILFLSIITMYATTLLSTALLFLSVNALPATNEARQCTGPNVNAATVSLIKEFEGFVPSPAPDPIGLPTVGYGHLCTTSGCSEVPYSFPLTTTTASQLLQRDLKVRWIFTISIPPFSYLPTNTPPPQSPQQTITLRTTSNVVLNANQYGALVSWAFNVGGGNVASSTLISRLNAGQNPNTVIAEELPRWNKAGGQVLPGLTRRRAAEVALARTATSVRALPACS